MPKHVKIFSDGSARGNPDGPGGYGAILQFTDSRGVLHEKELSEGFEKTTNNRMELLGVIVALVRSSYDTLKEELKGGFGKAVLYFFYKLCGIYLTVIRGTPVVVQLMIIYFVIFASSNNKIMVAVLAFGINSGAYVAEIIRGGIMSIDKGQFEAGRSLGFGYVRTMAFIIIPQAFKTVLPALANEFIVLIKETSVSGYVGLQELTKGGDIIRSRTYSAFMPLIAVAIIYLVIVMFFSWLVSLLERRLKNSER